ncbi:hypothetical protein WJX73_007340 [Symbiochloris irregularis]|uniref:ABC1 atypical kinase-like domain-containing protein n=1 Tax=Symbiochloris irregularis TaxID=706552 RepID=A0AAW1NXR5_9CHLO
MALATAIGLPQEQAPIAKAIENFSRASSFWRRILGVYVAYKATQARAYTMKAVRQSQSRVDSMWEAHHTWAGEQLYEICTDLRGFYIKVGQFMGARSDFIPEPICRKLSLLQDKVPPMSAAQTRAVIQNELGSTNLNEIFSSIDLDQPLGSATIAQVHRASLRNFNGEPETAVAVKVQYPTALDVMLKDLSNIRVAAKYLQDTELKFDLVSPVDELAKQIRLEFDFVHEASVMDSIAETLQSMENEVTIPRSIPGLVTGNLLVMSLLDGMPITRMQSRAQQLSQWQQDLGKRVLLSRVSEAYGRMILGPGLFQADCHPGNILVSDCGLVGLVDFGQCKQLPLATQLSFAELLLRLGAAGDAPLLQVADVLDPTDSAAIAGALTKLGIETGEGSNSTKVRLAFGMFDSRGRVDPFCKDSPLKAVPIKRFPPDLFFLLRVIQLLRGLSMAMGINDFSVAAQWRPLAEALLQEHGRLRTPVTAQGAWAWHGGLVLGGLTPADAVWWNALRKPLSFRLLPGLRITAIWLALYCLGGLGAAVASLAGGIVHQARMFGLVALQLSLHFTCSWLLFKSKRLGRASVVGCLSAAAAMLTTASFAEASTLAGLLMAPTALGVTIASLLLLGIYRSNGGSSASPAQQQEEQRLVFSMAGHAEEFLDVC